MEKQLGRKLRTILLLLMAAAISNAAPVDSLQALEVARQFVPQTSHGKRVKAHTGQEEAAIVYSNQHTDG